MRVRRVIRVHRRVGSSADRDRSVGTKTYQNYKNGHSNAVKSLITLAVGEHHQVAQKRKDRNSEEYHTAIYGHSERINREGVDRSTEGYGIWDDDAVDNAQNKERYNKGKANLKNIIPRRAVLIAAEKPYHHQRWDSKQVEDMYADRESHKVGDKDYPTHRGRAVGILLPLEHKPHYQCRKHRREGVNLTLDSREPEGVGIGIRQCSDGTRTENKNHTAKAHLLVVTTRGYATCQMRDSPKEEEDAEARSHAVHSVNHHRNALNRRGKERGYACQHHKEWRPWWVANLELV